MEPIPQVLSSTALEAIKTLRLYEEQADGDKVAWVNTLQGQEKVVKARQVQRLKQPSLDSLFSCTQFCITIFSI